MKKNIKCISEAISFMSDNFLYILRVTLPVMFLMAISLTLFWPLAVLPLLLLQGIMFRLLVVKRRGFEVQAQHMKSVYRSGVRNLSFAFRPKTLSRAFRYYFRHFRTFFSLTLCCLLFYGFIAFMVSVPQVAIHIIRSVVDSSRAMGDTVVLPSHLQVCFYACLFFTNYLLSIVLADCLLPFPMRWTEEQKDEAELQAVLPVK